MKTNRRRFLATTASLTSVPLLTSVAPAAQPQHADPLEHAAAQPILNLDLWKDPVLIDSIQLLRNKGDYLLHIRSQDGAEGLALDNGRLDLLHPILKELIIPYFIGKDARCLEDHLFEVYRFRSNYKLQGLAFWSPIALVEFALLDLLGRLAAKSIGQLLGPIKRERIPFYIASGRRDTTPQQEIDYLKKLLDEHGARAVKYRVGGRMSRNQDALPGRTESLIPLSRKALGDHIAIHADSNSSYDPPHAINIGRMLEDINAVYFEEPCPFDDFDATRKVAEALSIPVALGEQEFSHARFRYCIQNHVADIVQPDLFYYGGLIRSLRVARMAHLHHMPTTVHISGGFGFVYMLHFASVVPNIGPWQEYKEGLKTYGNWFNPPLRIIDGAITIPTAPGVGLASPSDILKNAKPFSG